MDEPSAQVPQKLLDELHEVNAKMHESKEDLEQEMDRSDYRHQERVDEAMHEVKEAERAVEDVEKQISEKLHAPPTG